MMATGTGSFSYDPLQDSGSGSGSGSELESESDPEPVPKQAKSGGGREHPHHPRFKVGKSRQGESQNYTLITRDKLKRQYGNFTPVYDIPRIYGHREDTVSDIRARYFNDAPFTVVSNQPDADDPRAKNLLTFMNTVIAIGKSVLKARDGLQEPLAVYAQSTNQIYIVEGFYIMSAKVLEAIQYGFSLSDLQNNKDIAQSESTNAYFYDVIMRDTSLAYAWGNAVGHRLVYNAIAIDSNAYVSVPRKRTVTAAHVNSWQTCVQQTRRAQHSQSKP